MRPGVEVVVSDAIPARSAPTDVGVWFVVGTTAQGPLGPQLVRSAMEYAKLFGARQGWETLYDPIDVAFREGLAKCFVSRVVGPAAALASATFAPIAVNSVGPGAGYNSLKVQIVQGSTTSSRILKVTDSAAKVLEVSPEFLDQPSMIAWSAQSQYIRVVNNTPADTVGLPAVTAATALTGGDDDRDAITSASYQAALDFFGKSLGPGQVSAPDNGSGLGVTTAVHKMLLAHAATRNRVALLDAPDTDLASELIAEAATLRSDENARYGGMFAPPAVVPGIIGVTSRLVGWSAVQAGLISKITNPNQPAAGTNGISKYALAASHVYSDSDLETLNEAGVDIAKNMFDGVRTYGYRTLADPAKLPQWVPLNTLRTIMAIKAQAEVIGERHIFKQIDGRGLEIRAFQGELMGMLLPYYNEGALYGETPEDAFYVDVGSQVNTPETIADGQLRAVISVRTSPFAELVYIEIIKLPLPSGGSSTTSLSPESFSAQTRQVEESAEFQAMMESTPTSGGEEPPAPV